MLRRLPIAILFLACALASAALVPSGSAAAQEREVMTFDDVAEIDELHEGHTRVLRLYWTFFDRRPDAGGALYWLDQYERCQTIERIAEFFNDSPEFVETYGDLDDKAFVQLVYTNTLDRDPDAAGAAYWIDRIQSDITRAELMVHFSFSVEFVNNHPLPSDGVPIRQCRDLGPVEGGQPRVWELSEWPVFGTVGDIELRQPSAAVELIGFHQSNQRWSSGNRQRRWRFAVVRHGLSQSRHESTRRRRHCRPSIGRGGGRPSPEPSCVPGATSSIAVTQTTTS